MTWHFSRRKFLQGLSLLPWLTTPILNAKLSSAAELHHDRVVDHVPAIPVLMFYRIEDNPRFPEDISVNQLSLLFTYMWEQGFRPVNISDIILGRVDEVVPKGFKPVGISTDAAHASIIFSNVTAPQGADGHPLNNTQSFVEILGSTLHGITTPRATFFLSVASRKATKESSYFGSIMPLQDIADVLSPMSGVEFGYQTHWHTRLSDLNGEQMTKVIEHQMEHLSQLNMLDKVQKIMAYPFGGRPNDEGMLALRNAKFLGGVLTYPGVGEAHYKQVPICVYDGKLMTDPFLIPRVSIGSHIYAKGNKPLKNPPLDPIEDFIKDVEKGIMRLYVSRGSN